MVDFPNPLFAESMALQAHGIDPVSMCFSCGRCLGKWHYVFGDGRPAADERIRSNVHKMMHWAKRADRGPFFDNYMPAKRRGVGQNYVVANHAVMRDVRIGHHQHVAAYARESAAFYSATVDCHKLPHLVVIAHLQPRRFTFVAQVLRRHANGAIREEEIARADFCRTFNGHMRFQSAVFANFNVRANHTIRANITGGMNLSFWINYGCGMDAHRGWVRASSMELLCFRSIRG